MDCNGSNPGYIPHLHGGTNVTELALVAWTLPMKVVFLKMMKMEGKRGDAIVEVIFATKTLTLLDGQKNIEQKYFTSKIEIKLFGNFHLDVLEFVLQFEGTLEVEKYRFQSNSLVKVQQKRANYPLAKCEIREVV